MVRHAQQKDAARVAEIYNHYVENTVVTFEEMPVSPEEMAQRIADRQAQYPYLVLEASPRQVAGFAYATSWKSRCAYRFSAETTIYLAPEVTGSGLGTQLYAALIEALREKRMHSLIGGVALPNDASVALHEKLGFKKVAHFEEVGRKFDRWIDVGYWELIL